MEPLGRKKDSAKLQWDTKPRRAVNPRDIEFQTAEIVIPNPARDQSTIMSFSQMTDNIPLDKSTMNRLIWGDNLLAMQALLASGYEGKIDLIYIDPPFWTGEDYYANFKIGGAEITKSPSVIERLAYKDIWEGGTDSFLDMLYPRLQLMRRLLAETGSIYVHIDWHMGHYVKVMMDEIFGKENFRNSITWVKSTNPKGSQHDNTRYSSFTDTILYFSKSHAALLNLDAIRKPLSAEQLAIKYDRSDEKGPFSDGPIERSSYMGPRPNLVYEYKNFTPGPWGWRVEKSLLQKIDANGDLGWTSNGKPYRKIRPESDKGDPIGDLWDDISLLNSQSLERVGYPTQKPLALIERIINASSSEGSIVCDFFAGSGTTAIAAEKLNRRWIACDFSKTSIQISRNRLVQNETKPFLMENIGNYQRQLIYLAGSRISEIHTIVLKLYGATPRKDYPDIGIKKVEDNTELVFVSYPDRPVTAKKAEELESLAERLDGKGYPRVVILGWDYEYNYDEILKKRQRSSRRKWYSEIVSKSIPPEVYIYLKAKTREPLESLHGKIRFHVKPYLKILKPVLKKTSGENWEVTIGIDKYVVFDYPVEKEEQKKQIQEIVRDEPLSLIDYWAVDWDYDNLTFKSAWQAMSHRRNNIVSIPKTVSKELKAKRLYIVAVRVVDVFGNDAASTVAIDLRGMS